VELNTHPVFNTADFHTACALVSASLQQQHTTTISRTLAPERKEPLRDPGCSPQIHVDQFRPVIRVLFEMREGRSITKEEMPDDDDIIQAIRYVTVSKDIDVQPCPESDLGNASTIEYEEGTLSGLRWTRRGLLKLACWPRDGRRLKPNSSSP
jgi:hypothetical protein